MKWKCVAVGKYLIEDYFPQTWIDNRHPHCIEVRCKFFCNENRDKSKKYHLQNSSGKIFFEKNRRETDLNFKLALTIKKKTHWAFKSQNVRKSFQLFIS